MLVGFISGVLMSQHWYSKSSTAGWHFHNVAGFTEFCLMSFQMILGIVVYRNTKHRLIWMHIMHGVLGHAQFFLACKYLYCMVF